LKASHVFNILDARGAISVAQRAGYIGRIRDITKAAAEIWLDSQS
jgi:glycyl-tRNA synthetase alpha chain